MGEPLVTQEDTSVFKIWTDRDKERGIFEIGLKTRKGTWTLVFGD